MPPENFPKRQVIAQRQSDALRTLLRTILPANPFYAAKLGAAGAPSKVSHLGDLYDRFPFTTKAELAADQTANPPYGSNLTFPLERYSRCHQTSGTNGQPLRWLDTPESWDWMLENWQAILRVAGVTRADTVFFAFSFGPFIGFWLAFEAALVLARRDGVTRLEIGEDVWASTLFDGSAAELTRFPHAVLFGKRRSARRRSRQVRGRSGPPPSHGRSGSGP